MTCRHYINIETVGETITFREKKTQKTTKTMNKLHNLEFTNKIWVQKLT